VPFHPAFVTIVKISCTFLAIQLSMLPVVMVSGTAPRHNTKLQLCHCEERFDFAQDKLRDAAIYPIEPALAQGTKLRA
jgi:hypothetical protein